MMIPMLIAVSYILPISKIANDPELMALVKDGKVCCSHWTNALYVRLCSETVLFSGLVG